MLALVLAKKHLVHEPQCRKPGGDVGVGMSFFREAAARAAARAHCDVDHNHHNTKQRHSRKNERKRVQQVHEMAPHGTGSGRRGVRISLPEATGGRAREAEALPSGH